MYLLVLLLFADRVAAFFAALLLALTPEQLLWSATAAVEPSASLACVAALLAAACFVRSRSTAALAGAAVATAYAVQFRPESFLIVPVDRAVAVAARARGVHAPAAVVGRRCCSCALVARPPRPHGRGAERRLGHDRRHAFSLALRRGQPARQRLVLPGGCAVSGGVSRCSRSSGCRDGVPKRDGWRWRATSCCSSGSICFFYAGSYNYGADVRYSLADLSAAGDPGRAGAGSTRRAGSERVAPRLPAGPALTAAVAFQFLWYRRRSFARRPTERGRRGRTCASRGRSSLDLRGNSYVLTHNPGMFQVWGVNAGQMSLADRRTQRSWTISAARFAGGVYLHWNFWCNVQDPVQRAFCHAGPRAQAGRARARVPGTGPALRPVPSERRFDR